LGGGGESHHLSPKGAAVTKRIREKKTNTKRSAPVSEEKMHQRERGRGIGLQF